MNWSTAFVGLRTPMFCHTALFVCLLSYILLLDAYCWRRVPHSSDCLLLFCLLVLYFYSINNIRVDNHTRRCPCFLFSTTYVAYTIDIRERLIEVRSYAIIPGTAVRVL